MHTIRIGSVAPFQLDLEKINHGKVSRGGSLLTRHDSLADGFARCCADGFRTLAPTTRRPVPVMLDAKFAVRQAVRAHHGTGVVGRDVAAHIRQPFAATVLGCAPHARGAPHSRRQ